MEVIGFGGENSQEKSFHLQNDRWFGRPVLTFGKGPKKTAQLKGKCRGWKRVQSTL